MSVGDADVAYQVFGDGPRDLLYFYGLGSHIEQFWDDAATAEFMRRLGSVARTIVFDRRGTGASDAVAANAIPTWEEWTQDIGAVLDAAGSSQAVILASLDGGPISILYTAAHPERVSGLGLHNTAARYLAAPDYPIGADEAAVNTLLDLIRTGWGTPDYTRLFSPSVADDPARAELLARQLRSAATPRTAAAQYNYTLRSVDVRSVLPLIQVPTVVFHQCDNPFLPLAHGRYLAEHITGAQLVPLDGGDFQVTQKWDPIIDKMTQLLTGRSAPTRVDRVLTTLMFTDIVDSTGQAARIGDRRWHRLLDSHDDTVRVEIESARGREIKTTGDGFLASFDGPARAIRCGRAIVEQTKRLGLSLRVGLHTGECEVRGDDLGGLTVHIAARVVNAAGPEQVVVSGTVKDLVIGSGIEFTELGDHQLKGVPGTWRLFSVAGSAL